jgi:two-component system, cell cycle sensor histidine kinase and response regulator CckA
MPAASILVVEDNAATRKLLRVALSAEGFSVIEAPDGRTAIEQMTTVVPDMVLQDLILPDMDGFDLARRLRALPGSAEVPILALSGFMSRMEEARAAGSAFNAFLLKPVEPSRLVETINAHLPRGTGHTENLGQGRLALVVDDDPVQLKLNRLFLERLGFRVATATSGAEAIAVARSSNPDVILSDVVMPRVDGFELCQKFRSDARLAKVPFVLISAGHSGDEDQRLAERVGANALILRTPDLRPVAMALLDAIRAGPPAVRPDEPVLKHADHVHRLAKELEHHIGLVSGLARRCSVQAAELSLLGGVADALTASSDTEVVLRDVLGACLDAIGISKGALYLVSPEGRLGLRYDVGFSDEERKAAEGFFGEPRLLEQALSQKAPLSIPSEGVSEGAARGILAKAGAVAVYVVPLVADGESLGALILAPTESDAKPEDPITFARAIAGQLAKTIALQRTFSRLSASEARYRALLDNANDAIAVLTPDGTFREVNRRWEEMNGRKREEVIGSHISITHAPGAVEMNKELYRRAVAQGSGSTAAVALRRPDGKTIYADFSTSVVDLGAERVVLSISRDVTARHESEEALRASEARFQRLSESGVVGIVVADVHGNVLEANDVYLRMIGYTREELHSGGVSWASMTPPEWRASDERAGEQLKTTGVATPWEKELIRKDGTRVPILIGVTMLEYPRCISVVTDMTERKRAEQAHRRTEERFRILFDTIPLPTFVFDAETLRFLEVNEAAVRTYGWSKKELLGMTGRDIRPPEELPRYLDAVMANPPGFTDFGVWKHRRKDGTVFDVEVAGHGFVLGNRPARLALVRDISERRQLEAQLQQSKKMEAVGRLAGGVAHDFNNMLAVILSYSSLLLKDLPAGDPLRGDAEEIKKAGERAASLTRQLLAFSRQQVLEPRPVHLNEIMTHMDKMLRRLIGEDVELSTRPAPNIGTVSVDPGQMEQVIMNLVVNSRDAMPRGGKLTIETARVDIDETAAREHLGLKRGPHVMLAVSDTGAGMDTATQAHIFEPFFTTKEKGKGTGLGLSTVFGIVKQSGGSIYVYSEVGKGTTFKIYLPCVDGSVNPAHRETATVSTLKGTETILLVEDEEQVRNVAREVLKRNGYRVIEAKNAGEALLISERPTEDIALLLTDVVMPQMSGPELAKRLATTRPRMKVLCMSGYTDQAIVNHGFLGSGIAFLEKPFTPEALARKVREVLDRPV